MRQHISAPPNRPFDRLRRADRMLCWTLTCLLPVLMLVAKANIMADPVDFYGILQRIVRPGDVPLVPANPIVEQRSPGFSLLSLPAAYLLEGAVRPLVRTQEIPFGPGPSRQQDAGPGGDLGLRPMPAAPLPVSGLLFKDFRISPEEGVLRWSLLGALILTNAVFLVLGIVAASRALLDLGGSRAVLSLAPLIVIGSPMFLLQIVDAPAYSTLTAFGLSACLAYVFARGWRREDPPIHYLSGLCAGLLVLTRLETVVLAAVLSLFLLLERRWSFVRRFLIAGLVPLAILIVYSVVELRTPLPFALLKGDINRILVHPRYLTDALINPASGIFVWSPLIMLGIGGLFIGRDRLLSCFGVAALALLALYCLRVPVMYLCSGETAPRIIGDLSVACWPADAVSFFVRGDMNRYLTVLAPFSLLGLQNLIGRVDISRFAQWRMSRSA